MDYLKIYFLLKNWSLSIAMLVDAGVFFFQLYWLMVVQPPTIDDSAEDMDSDDRLLHMMSHVPILFMALMTRISSDFFFVEVSWLP